MDRNQLRLSLVALAMLIALGAAGAVAPVRAAVGERCFPETGFCIAGPIRDYWERNGGLAVFGFPISPQRLETIEGSWSGPVQWFERDRLEDHGVQGVLAGRLGDQVLALQGRPWRNFAPINAYPPECRYFAETGHSLCGIFLRYWERNGGLERFGYPLSEPMVESLGDWTGSVQYFERRRMEHHTELAGTAYEVLLGLLGRDLLAAAANPACANAQPVVAFGLEYRLAPVLFRNALTCPATSYTGVAAAFQPFEHGTMIWLDLGSGNRQIIVTKEPGRPAPDQSWQQIADTYKDGDPLPIAGTPPPGLYLPQRGFGKIWAGSRGQGQWVGYATAPEQAEVADVQYFGGGGLFVRLRNADQLWIFGPRYNQLAQR